MSSARNDLEAYGGRHTLPGVLVQLDHRLVGASHDQQSWSDDPGQGVGRQVWTAATRDYRPYELRPLSCRDQRRRCASAGAETADAQVIQIALVDSPVDGGNDPPTKPRDIETKLVRKLIDGLFMCRQQIQQQRCEAGSRECLGDFAVPGTVSAASAPMRKHNQSCGRGRQP